MEKTEAATNQAENVPAKVLVVDDDGTQLIAMTKILKDLGIAEITTKDNGEDAWMALQAGKFDCIILDWKMSPLSGANLLHRIRSSKLFSDVPVLVASGYLKKRDFSFAEEYQFTSMIEKPFDSFFLSRRIKDLIKERNWYEKEKTRINSALEKTTDLKKELLTELSDTLAASPRIVAVSLYAARCFFDRGDLDCAELILKRLLDKSPECVLGLTLWGKILLHRRNFDEALKTLQVAQRLSPENPDRLCMLGSANLQMLKTEEASENFAAASKLDPSFDKAKSGTELVKNVSNYLDSEDLAQAPSSFASLMNAIGVAFVKKKSYQEGLKHYEAAIQYVDQDVMQSRLAFNLGLGFLRWQRKEEALKWFKTSATLGGAAFQKAGQYVEKLTSGQTPTSIDLDEVEATPTIAVPAQAPKKAGTVRLTATSTKPAPAQPVTPEEPPSAFGFNEDSFLSEPSEPDTPKAQPAQFGKMEGKKGPAVKDSDPFVVKLQELMKHLIMADKSLFNATGNAALLKTHEAFGGVLDGKKVAVFVPNTHAPQLLARPENLEIVKGKVFVQEKVGNFWQPVWPREAKKMSA